MAVDIAKESTDMFLPLKAVVGALSVLIKNYDVKYTQTPVLSTVNRFLQQTVANAKQIEDIEERVQSLAEVLAYPVDGLDGEEKARREVLRGFVHFRK